MQQVLPAVDQMVLTTKSNGQQKTKPCHQSTVTTNAIFGPWQAQATCRVSSHLNLWYSKGPAVVARVSAFTIRYICGKSSLLSFLLSEPWASTRHTSIYCVEAVNSHLSLSCSNVSQCPYSRRYTKQTSLIFPSVIKNSTGEIIYIVNNFPDPLHPTAKKQDKQKHTWQAIACLLKVPRHFHSRLKTRIYWHPWIMSLRWQHEWPKWAIIFPCSRYFIYVPWKKAPRAASVCLLLCLQPLSFLYNNHTSRPWSPGISLRS